MWVDNTADMRKPGRSHTVDDRPVIRHPTGGTAQRSWLGARRPFRFPAAAICVLAAVITPRAQSPSYHARNTPIRTFAISNVTKTTRKPTARKPATRKPATKATTTTVSSSITTLPPVTAVGVQPGGDAQPPLVPTANFTACANSALDCTTVTVPLDHANPAGTTVSLFVSRRRANDASRRLGVLFVNPGGPGGPAYDTVRSASTYLTPEMLDRFDIIGVDPRGTERSAPLACDASKADRFSRLTFAEQLAEACATTDSERLKFMDTETAARDLDDVRVAIGERKISYLGMSYGTYLGAVYESLFPGQVASMVLDSAVDPSRFGVNMLVDPVIATEKALDAFLAECQSGRLQPCAFNDGTDLNAKYLAVRERAISSSRSNRELATQRFDETVASFVGYPRNGWPVLGRALEEQNATGRGNFRTTSADNLATSNDEQLAPLDSFSTATNLSINCRDGILPRDSKADQLVRDQIVASPRFSGLASNALAADTCETWPTPTANLVPLKRAPAALLIIGNTFDLTTPYPWSEALSRTLAAPLLTRNGGGHVAVNKSRGVREAVARLFIDRTLPLPGTVCSPDLANPS